MTDGQFAALMAVLASLGGSLIAALRWAVGRVTKSNDDGTAALIANTASNAVLVVKLDAAISKIDNIFEWIESYTPIRAVPKPRPGTSPVGVPVAERRRGRVGDDSDR